MVGHLRELRNAFCSLAGVKCAEARSGINNTETPCDSDRTTRSQPTEPDDTSTNMVFSACDVQFDNIVSVIFTVVGFSRFLSEQSRSCWSRLHTTSPCHFCFRSCAWS